MCVCTLLDIIVLFVSLLYDISIEKRNISSVQNGVRLTLKKVLLYFFMVIPGKSVFVRRYYHIQQARKGQNISVQH